MSSKMKFYFSHFMDSSYFQQLFKLREQGYELEMLIEYFAEKAYDRPVQAGHDNRADADTVEFSEESKAHDDGSSEEGEIKNDFEPVHVELIPVAHALDKEIINLRIDIRPETECNGNPRQYHAEREIDYPDPELHAARCGHVGIQRRYQPPPEIEDGTVKHGRTEGYEENEPDLFHKYAEYYEKQCLYDVFTLPECQERYL